MMDTKRFGRKALKVRKSSAQGLSTSMIFGGVFLCGLIVIALIYTKSHADERVVTGKSPPRTERDDVKLEEAKKALVIAERELKRVELDHKAGKVSDTALLDVKDKFSSAESSVAWFSKSVRERSHSLYRSALTTYDLANRKRSIGHYTLAKYEEKRVTDLMKRIKDADPEFFTKSNPEIIVGTLQEPSNEEKRKQWIAAMTTKGNNFIPEYKPTKADQEYVEELNGIRSRKKAAGIVD